MASVTTTPVGVRDDSRVDRVPLRVTHVVFDFNGGGMESLVADMAARFQGSCVKISLVTLSGRVGRLGAATRDTFETFQVIRPIPVASLALPHGAAAAIRRTRPDVVHLHTGAWYKGALAARLSGARRVVYTEHGREHHDPALSRWLDRRAAAFTDAVVAVSGRLSAYLAREVGIPRSKICTIHNGVDTSVFTPGDAPSDLRQSLRIPDEALVIGSVGRLESVKAYDTLIEGAALLRARKGRPFVLVIFGDGSQREALDHQIDRLDLRDIVRLPGWTSCPTSAYRLIDLFVLPSRSEGQSVSLMEAMSCGATPVVTNVGANAEMLGPELSAHVVAPDAPQVLADALSAASSSSERMNQVGALARRRAIEMFSVERMLERYELLYRGSPIFVP